MPFLVDLQLMHFWLLKSKVKHLYLNNLSALKLGKIQLSFLFKMEDFHM
jgi:hypothetical protein